MPEEANLGPDTLDELLAGVIRDNRERVVGWMSGEPGCWGFLAGQAVVTCRNSLGRTLSDQERRQVWHRLWWLLEQVKARVAG